MKPIDEKKIERELEGLIGDPSRLGEGLPELVRFARRHVDSPDTTDRILLAFIWERMEARERELPDCGAHPYLRMFFECIGRPDPNMPDPPLHPDDVGRFLRVRVLRGIAHVRRVNHHAPTTYRNAYRHKNNAISAGYEAFAVFLINHGREIAETLRRGESEGERPE